MATIFLPNNNNAANYGQLNTVASGLTWMPSKGNISLLHLLSKLGIKSARAQLGGMPTTGQTFYDTSTGNIYMVDANGSLLNISSAGT